MDESFAKYLITKHDIRQLTIEIDYYRSFNHPSTLEPV